MKPILFIDFDGTLCHDRFWRSLDPQLFERITVFTSRRDISRAWMLGEYTAEEVNKIAAEEIGIPYQELWDIFVQDASTMEISKLTLQRIGSLRSKYQTILMTDNMDSLDRFTAPAHNLDQYFDAIVNSYTARRGKNDDNGKLFLDTAVNLGANIENCVLIDNAPSGCELFSSLGGKALLVDTTKDLDSWLAELS